VYEFYSAAASDAGVKLEIIAPPGMGAPLDRVLFQRAVCNLVENSMAHTSSGGHIRVEAAQNDGALRIAVADDGSGIPEEHLPHIFDRFYRVDAARARNSGGTGLGLAIVRSVAVLHGGEAWIESTVGRGTRVTLLLPAK